MRRLKFIFKTKKTFCIDGSMGLKNIKKKKPHTMYNLFTQKRKRKRNTKQYLPRISRDNTFFEERS